jgi:hypothetical protein
MPTKREYAVSLGLAKNGRGKLSKAAHEAINKAIKDGMVFDDVSGTSVGQKPPTVPTPPKTESKRVVAALPETKVYREQSTVYGIDSKPGFADLVIAFDDCAGCGKAVKYCSHETPLLPKWLGGGTALMEKP